MKQHQTLMEILEDLSIEIPADETEDQLKEREQILKETPLTLN